MTPKQLRQQHIVRRIAAASGPVQASELAEETGFDTRTIRRDVGELQRGGVQIRSVPGMGYISGPPNGEENPIRVLLFNLRQSPRARIPAELVEAVVDRLGRANQREERAQARVDAMKAKLAKENLRALKLEGQIADLEQRVRGAQAQVRQIAGRAARGEVVSSAECHACNGERVVICRRCEGSGRLGGLLRPCSLCAGKGEAACVACVGVG